MILKNCKQCGIEFRAREWKNRPGIFCSQVCQRKGRQMREIKTITFECESCKKECSQPLYWKCPHKYCSIQCMANERGKRMRGANHPKWIGGTRQRPWKYTKLINEIKKTKKICERCGIEEKLEAHHKIKTSERPDLLENLENIEFICSQCHANEHPEFKGMILKKKVGVYLKCKICSKEYYRPKYLENTSTCCSRECSIQKLVSRKW